MPYFRSMKYISAIILILVFTLGSGPVLAESSMTFGDAKSLSARDGKPILLEFVRED